MSEHLEEDPEQSSRLDASMKTSRFAFSNHPQGAQGARSCASMSLLPAAQQSAGEHLVSFKPCKSSPWFQWGFLLALKISSAK